MNAEARRAARGGAAKDIRLAELLGALCHALDLTEGQPPGHCVRCCWIGIHIGRELGFAEADLHDLYYVLLLKDLGCSSNAARICQLYLTDDLSFKRDFKQINDSLPQALRFVLSHTGLGAGLAERFRAIIGVLQNGGEIAKELIETRCQRGADIARRMHFSEPVAAGIQNLDEHWDGGGKPTGVKAHEIPLLSQIALLAQVVDVFQTSAGQGAANDEICRRSGNWFAPEIVEAFLRVSARPDFWSGLHGDNLQARILELEPAQYMSPVDEDYLDEIAAAFAQVVDSKSPFTNGHSERVAVFADLIAAELSFTSDERRWLKRAALLHDIGKLGVSNTILDKQGKPNAEEWDAIRMHAVHTETILSRISAFSDMAAIAAAHHERLDGKGYPKGLAAADLCLESRILSVADIFDALTADRPYRKAMPMTEAFTLMDGMVDTAIDGGCLGALRRAIPALDISEAA
jgi:HD-GYP domain-containing protein (c-di-GMP phosphodiesterase class II)